jgi:hypothetical protein
MPAIFTCCLTLLGDSLQDLEQVDMAVEQRGVTESVGHAGSADVSVLE